MRPRLGTWTALRSFAAADRRTVAGDRVVLLVLAGLPLIAVALRWLAGPGVAWSEARYGFDLTPHLPVVAAFVLALHLPVMVGTVVGLLFLEDRVAGLLPPLAVTPAGTGTLAAYRLATAGLVAAAAVVVGTVIAGTGHLAGAAGVAATAVAGAAVATVPATLLATFGRDRVQGMALVKAMGVPLYAPIAWWYVSGPAGWGFAVLPTGWAARTSWADSAAGAAGAAAVCVAVSVAIVVVLRRRSGTPQRRAGSRPRAGRHPSSRWRCLA